MMADAKTKLQPVAVPSEDVDEVEYMYVKVTGRTIIRLSLVSIFVHCISSLEIKSPENVEIKMKLACFRAPKL